MYKVLHRLHSNICQHSVSMLNLLPSSVQPAPAMIQRLLHDAKVFCTACNKHTRAGWDYDTHDCHKADVQEEICASTVICRILSESTKDNIIQIQTGGTVSKEWVMSVYLLSSSVAIDPCACDKGPIFPK